MKSASTTLNRAIRSLLVALLVLPVPVAPAVIVVDGSCSLADAVIAANNDSATGGCAAGSGADEIQLTDNVTLLEALPGVASDITVAGNSLSIVRDDAAPSFRIFRVEAGSLALSSVTVSNGDADGGSGGAIYQYPYTTLTLDDTTVSGNSALFGGGIAAGEYSSGTISNSTVSGNVASTLGGGLFLDGGGLEVYSHTLINSTVSGNSAGTKGGGAYAWYWHDLIVINSTISGNTAGSVGGGIFLGNKGEIDLVNSTIVGNSSPAGGGLAGYPYWGPVGSGSVFGYNVGGACAAFNPPFNDFGGNLDDDGTCGAGFGNLSGLDPTLADNGGPTLTHALLDGSSAIDAAGDCGLDTDQRGFAREDGACDSGAFEVGGAPAQLLLSVTGTCPGVLTIDVATPLANQRVNLFAGAAPGTFTLPGGPCAGTELDMNAARVVRQMLTDGDGSASFSREFEGRWCGKLLQAVDSTCAASNVAPIP